MKKIYTLIGIALTTLTVSKVAAQNIVDNFGNIRNFTEIARDPWKIENTVISSFTNTDNIYQNGNVGIGDFSATTTTQKLDIIGNMRVRGLVNGADTIAFPRRVVAMPDGTLGYSPHVSQPWKVVGTDIEATQNTQNIYQNGRVQIGTTNLETYPNSKAVIVGNPILAGSYSSQLIVANSGTASNVVIGLHVNGGNTGWFGLNRANSSLYWNTEALGTGNTFADAKMELTALGVLKLKDINATGDIYAQRAFISNTITGTTATLSGNISAASGTFTGNVSAGSYTTTSDARLKRNIKPIENALEIVNALKPVHYEKKDQLNAKEYKFKEYGFIAQDLEKVLPEMVHTDPSADHIKSVNYTEVISILTKAIQENQKAIQENQKEIDVIKKMIKK